MKKMLIGILCISCLFGVAHAGHCYTRKGCEVVEVFENEVVVKDRVGNPWSFYGKGFSVGDTVNLRMHDNCSDNNIYDDVIKSVEKSSGF